MPGQGVAPLSVDPFQHSRPGFNFPEGADEGRRMKKSDQKKRKTHAVTSLTDVLASPRKPPPPAIPLPSLSEEGYAHNGIIDRIGVALNQPPHLWDKARWRMMAESLARELESRGDPEASIVRVVSALTPELRRKGGESTAARPEAFTAALFQYLVRLLRSEPILAEGRFPQVQIAERVRTDEAAQSNVENKNWNRTANRKTAGFIPGRRVRAEVAELLPAAKHAAGIATRIEQ
jgi:hypothetical protein